MLICGCSLRTLAKVIDKVIDNVIDKETDKETDKVIDQPSRRRFGAAGKMIDKARGKVGGKVFRVRQSLGVAFSG